MFAKRDWPVIRIRQRGSYVVAVAHRGYEVSRLAGYALGHGRL